MKKSKMAKFALMPAFAVSLIACGGKPSTDLTVTELLAEPATSKYFVDYEFKKADLNVTAKYSDGSVKTISDYDVDPSLPYTFKEDDVKSGKDFTISYKDKKKTINVSVVKPVLDKLTVNTSKTSYEVGDELKDADLSVMATYTDGKTVQIKSGFNVNPNLPYTFVDGDVTDGKDIIVTYQDKTGSAHVGVEPKKKEVTITFKNDDDQVLETKNVKIGDEISYTGVLPKKSSSMNGGVDVFIGWDGELGTADKDKTFKAQYKTLTTIIDKDHDGIPEGIDTDNSSNYFEVGAKSFVYLDQNITIDFSKFLVDGANTKYDNEIAKLGLFLSNPKIDFKDGLFQDKVYGGRENAMYARLGCDDFHHFDFKDEAAKNYKYDKFDTTSGCVAHKYLYDDDGNIQKDLIIIAFEGTNGKNRWASNFDVGYDSEDYYGKMGSKDSHPEWTDKRYHKGFYVGAKRVLEETIEGEEGVLPGPVQFLKYINDHSKSSNGKPIIFVTGHSRGGAMANIIGQYLENDYKNETKKDCIPFTYAFAAPSVWGVSELKPQTSTLFNIINSDDLVTKVPHSTWDFSRLGNDVLFKSVKDEYEEEYNKNREGRLYQRIENGDSILALVGTTRENIYKITYDDENLSTSELKTYATEAEANDDLPNVIQEYKDVLGEEFSRFYDLKVVHHEAGLLYDEYWAIQAYNCFGIMTKIISNIMINDTEFIGNFSYWLPLVSNSKYKDFLLQIITNIIAGGTDTVGLPHDYGAYHIILRQYEAVK